MIIYFRLQTNDTHSSDEVELKGGVNFKPEENQIYQTTMQIKHNRYRVLLNRYVSFRFDVNSLHGMYVRLYVSSQNDVTTTQPHITYINCLNGLNLLRNKPERIDNR